MTFGGLCLVFELLLAKSYMDQLIFVIEGIVNMATSTARWSFASIRTNLYMHLIRNDPLSYRYHVTKLMEVLFTRELITRLGSSTRVNMNLVDPGLCIFNLDRKSGRPPDMLRLVRLILNRTTEVGSRALVLAALAGARQLARRVLNLEAGLSQVLYRKGITVSGQISHELFITIVTVK